MPSDAKERETLHNTASNGPVCHHLVNGDHVCSRIRSMNDLVHIEAEMKTSVLDIRLWQVWHCVAGLNKFSLKWHIMVQYFS